ncbi:hypothetical protein GGR57DRAFT_508822 [Xylariaceae sp. FL1272]|nr:hypothetical protein GGR57DRAFT_508822 [Xylariaceae sp. FL1272]
MAQRSGEHAGEHAVGVQHQEQAMSHGTPKQAEYELKAAFDTMVSSYETFVTTREKSPNESALLETLMSRLQDNWRSLELLWKSHRQHIGCSVPEWIELQLQVGRPGYEEAVFCLVSHHRVSTFSPAQRQSLDAIARTWGCAIERVCLHLPKYLILDHFTPIFAGATKGLDPVSIFKAIYHQAAKRKGVSAAFVTVDNITRGDIWIATLNLTDGGKMKKCQQRSEAATPEVPGVDRSSQDSEKTNEDRPATKTVGPISMPDLSARVVRAQKAVMEDEERISEQMKRKRNMLDAELDKCRTHTQQVDDAEAIVCSRVQFSLKNATSHIKEIDEAQTNLNRRRVKRRRLGDLMTIQEDLLQQLRKNHEEIEEEVKAEEDKLAAA